MQSNRTKLILRIILIAFVLYNLFWLYSINKTYTPYKKALGGASYLSKCIMKDGNYTYGVSSPSYLSYVGNLSISEDIIIEEDGSSNATCDLIIWPLRDGSYEIGVNIFSGTIGHTTNQSIGIMLDENMQLVGNYDPETIALYNNSLDKIKNLYELADKKWGIFK